MPDYLAKAYYKDKNFGPLFRMDLEQGRITERKRTLFYQMADRLACLQPQNYWYAKYGHKQKTAPRWITAANTSSGG